VTALAFVSAGHGIAAASSRYLPPECKVTPGGRDAGTTPWAERRLGFQKVWPVTDGRDVRVAVIDSGVNRDQPQMARIRYGGGTNVWGGGFGPSDTRDCYWHGTAVTGIIAAPKVPDVAFLGVAPGVTVVPIKQSNQQNDGTAQGIAAGIDAAIAAHVKVVNVSWATDVDVPIMRAAIARAEAHDVVVVAAASNDAQSGNLVAYPAAYPTVLAVAATDNQDQVAKFSETGTYVDVAAPGVQVEAPAPISGYLPRDGTSFAAPFVTGTVALVRSAHPGLTAAQVRARIEATADPPPGATVPSRAYGFGIVNPYLAVTAVRDDAAGPPAPARRVPFGAAGAAPGPDRHLAHLALGIGTILLGLAIVAGLAAAVVRRGSWLRPTPR
jgi:type VII secretion-associated serine protease mycosin